MRIIRTWGCLAPPTPGSSLRSLCATAAYKKHARNSLQIIDAKEIKKMIEERAKEEVCF